MKNTLLILFLSTILSLVVACNKDDNNCDITESPICLEMVNMDESFVAKKGCLYQTIMSIGGDTVTVEVLDIADRRNYGVVCQSSSGGSADVSVKVTINNSERLFRPSEQLRTFGWVGCDGEGEYDPNMPNLPKLDFSLYTLKMMKMYPISDNQESPPTSKEDYGIRLIIMEQ
jgi:hypothetical protein